MNSINTRRVLMGGLLAGLIINICEFVLNTMVLGADMTAGMAKLGLPMIGNQAIAVFVTFGFLEGIIMVWLYAAIRPRLGPGPGTATRVAAIVWFFASLVGGVGMIMMGLFPSRMLAIGMAWGLVELIVASNAGAYFYRE
jgi:hypothetical protein